MSASQSSVKAPASAPTAIPASVVSIEAEKAVRLLMVTVAQYRRGEAALAGLPQIGGRLQVLPAGSVTGRVRRESVLVRSVSILESYVHGQLVARLDPLVPPPRSELVETLYGEFEDRGVTSWPQTEAYFKKHVHSSVKLKSHQSWNRVNAVIEARNAVVHGLGRFTARQARREVPKQVTTHLKALKFDIPADLSRVIVTPTAVREMAVLLRDYVEWLDGLLASVP